MDNNIDCVVAVDKDNVAIVVKLSSLFYCIWYCPSLNYSFV